MAELYDPQLGAASNALFNTALAAYLLAMVGYFFRMAFTRVAEGQTTSTAAGRRIGVAATVVASVGALAHTASIVTRGLAAERVPWANMYEYSSGLSLLAVVIGLVVLQRRLGLGHLMGFVLATATVTMAIALMLYTDPGPVVPALQSYWIRIHVTAAMVASAIFMVAFAASALYLVKDTAERRVAERSGQGFTGSTVGAASLTPGAEVADGQAGAVATGEAASSSGAGASLAGEGAVPAAGGDQPDDRLDGDAVEAAGYVSPLEQRRVLSAWPFGVVPAAVVGPFTLVVYQAPVTATVAAAVAATIGLLARWSVPHLPDAKTLDTLAYRTIAFGFPIWTFSIIAGAVWAEEAWGRFWGWDPKETGSFFTWVLYAAYLHARSTSGWRGRRAAWIAVVSFAALMVTYYVVNLFVVGLHSYAGV